MKLFSSVLIAASLATAAPALAMPACAPAVEIPHLPIARVEKNGDLISPDGRAVKPEGILLPAGARDHAPQFLAAQAVQQLSDLTRGRVIAVAANPPKEDRYGRIRAQAFFTDGDSEDWLQIAMLKRGLARVSILPDRPECAADLYAAEAYARANRFGIWAIDAYAIRDASTISLGDLGTFQIVQGTVTNASVRDGRAYINFGADYRNDFTVTVSPDDLKTFRDAGIDPANYAGKTIRVRGIVEKLNGPEIEIASPQSVEMVTDLRPALH